MEIPEEEAEEKAEEPVPVMEVPAEQDEVQ